MEKTNDEQIMLPVSHATLVVNMINIISKRGGFLPDEFKSIGEVYEVLKNQLTPPKDSTS